MTEWYEQEQFEIQRLVLLGRERPGPPSRIQGIIARTINPSAWSDHSDEQIGWCDRYGRTKSQTHFGAQYLISRRLSLIKADDVMRALGREAKGLPALRRLDARELSKRLKAWLTTNRPSDPRRYVSWKPADHVFLMYCCDGIPEPAGEIGETGEVTLTWTEGSRTARLVIDLELKLTLSLEPSCKPPEVIFLESHRPGGRLRLGTATDWIYHGGAHPDEAEEEQPTGYGTAVKANQAEEGAEIA
jgi:hypothetical protein